MLQNANLVVNPNRNGKQMTTDEHKNQSGQLLDAYTTVLRRLGARIGRMLSGAEDAQDIMQDAFIRLWSRPDATAPDDATALTATTARRLAIDSYRRHARRPEVPIDEQTDALPDDDDTQARHERYEAVRRIIDTRLTPQQREVLTLRDIDCLPYADIATRLGIDETAVRMRLSRARKAVRDIYESGNY